ncbi:hypothetical protein [Halobacillus trueperi]|uniref:Uncharacterized protein n=1 Tax=Halobacillus trueperi TaxID=156205 RepID=A0A3E0JBR9_9BACI|nr:hypothetical protein [Halobacillus trueperi]REJ10376.1 hypothetical protein DYE48_02495 [Halobacillus trueperi]
MKKKIMTVVSIAILLLMGVFTGSASAELRTGNISWYNGVGKVGYHGKVLDSNDCATELSVDNPPAGTSLDVLNYSNGESGICQKWDGRQNFDHYSVILDVQKSFFENVLGEPSSVGWIDGRYSY